MLGLMVVSYPLGSLAVDNNCDGITTVIQLNSAHYKFTGETNGDEAGYSIANAGDVDGDGTDDILIGAPLWYW